MMALAELLLNPWTAVGVVIVLCAIPVLMVYIERLEFHRGWLCCLGFHRFPPEARHDDLCLRGCGTESESSHPPR